MHFPRLSPIAISVSLFLLYQARAQAFGEEILWPVEGQFPAYPAEKTTSNFDFMARGGATYDSNFLRLADSESPPASLTTDRSATTYYAGAGIDAKTQISQQSFNLLVWVDQYWFDKLSLFNHTEHHGTLGWQWNVGDALSGDLGVTHNRSLSNFGDIQAAIKDLMTYQDAHFSAGWKFLQNWRIRGLAQDTRYSHSSDALRVVDNYTTTGTVGLDFITAGQSSIGLQYAEGRGNYPYRVSAIGLPVDGRYRDYVSGGALDWKISEDSELKAQVGYTRREHNDPTIPPFSGGTGRIDLKTSPSAKVLFNWSVYREVQSVEDLAASYVTARGISFAPAWAISLKRILQAALIYEKRDIVGTAGVTALTTPSRSQDITRAARLSAGYTPIDNLRFTLRYEHGNRSSTIQTASYSYNMGSLEAVFRF